MRIYSPGFIEFLKEKASHSPSAYRISAVAFDYKGDVLGHATNTISPWNDLESYRCKCKDGTSRAGMGLHAERRLIQRYGSNIRTIVICRVGASGDLLPIHPCKVCQKVANKLGIKIISIKA